MQKLTKRKSISEPFQPVRVDFFYISPLQKNQEQVQDPERPNFIQEINGNSVVNSHQKGKQSVQSFDNKTNFETYSQNNSIASLSLELIKIKRRYLDDFVFLNNLGKGTFGRVEKVRGRETNHIFAAKTLLKTRCASTNKYKNRKLEGQIKIYEKLFHPNIPELYSIYTWKNEYTLIIQYVEGANLHRLMDNHPNQQKKIARIMLQILDVLEYLHGLNIVHHDIKPENIIFDPQSQIAKVFDFGQAVQLNSSIETIQKPGGTYAYFAPEHFKDECSPKIDIWACGLILYYLLDGKIYFYDSIRDEMKKNILYKTVTFEGYHWSNRSQEVKDLILKMLEKDPNKRISAIQAKNDIWIVQNCKNWYNPARNIVRSTLRSTNRSFSIQNQVQHCNNRKISCDLVSLMKSTSYKKLSRFRNN